MATRKPAVHRGCGGLLPVAVVLLALAATPTFAQKTDDDLLWDLCDGTMAALENTPAAPLAAQFSGRAGSLLLAQGDKALHLSRAQLLKMDNWAEQPAFSGSAEVQPIMSEPPGGEFSHLVGMITDRGKEFWLDGITVREGGTRKWLTLTILPHAEVAIDKQLDGFRATLKPFFTALADSDGAAADDLLAPDVAMCMPGADGKPKVFATAADFEAELGRIRDAGGLRLSDLDMTEGVLATAAATVTVGCKMTIGADKTEDVTLIINLYLDGGKWRVVGMCAT